MSKSMTRQAILVAFAALFGALVALAMAPSAAFADDQDPYFTVYISEQTGVDAAGVPVYGEKKAVKTFATQADFEALAKTDGLAFVYKAGEKYVAYGTKSYVTLDDIVKALPEEQQQAWSFDGRISIGETTYNNGQLITKGNTIGTYNLKFDVDSKDDTKVSEENGDGELQPVFALSYASSDQFSGPADVTGIGDANTALGTAKTNALAAAAVSTDCPIFLQGKEKKKGVLATSKIPKNVKSITLHKPVQGAFTVRTKVDGKTKLAKWFTADALKELAKKNSGTKYYLFNTTIIKAESYVTLDQILEAANVSFMLDDSLGFVCYDGEWTKAKDMTPALLSSGQFFPAYAFGKSYDANGAESVPAIFALRHGSPNKTAANANASDYATGKQAVTATDEVYPRFCAGTAAEAFLSSGPRPGSDFPSGVNTLTVNIVTTDLAKATITVADQNYTGSALTPDVEVSIGSTKLVKDRDYTVAFTNNTEIGTANVTIIAKDTDHFKGSATATFAIKDTKEHASNINSKKVTAAQIKAAAALGATSITLGANVKSIAPKAFKGTGVKRLIIKSTKLTKKGVKNALKGSKVKTVKVPKSMKKAYKKFFAKANCGKKVTVK